PRWTGLQDRLDNLKRQSCQGQVRCPGVGRQQVDRTLDLPGVATKCQEKESVLGRALSPYLELCDEVVAPRQQLRAPTVHRHEKYMFRQEPTGTYQHALKKLAVRRAIAKGRNRLLIFVRIDADQHSVTLLHRPRPPRRRADKFCRLLAAALSLHPPASSI